jgi:hypothetical protein
LAQDTPGTHLSLFKEANMATNLFCPNCKSTSSLKSKVCRKCGQDFGDNRKYRVVVKLADGHRVSKVLDSLAMARKLERKLKDEVAEKKLFGIAKAPLVDDIWLEYLKWAKQNKKRWKEEEWRWKSHIEPHLKGKTMDMVIPHDISNLIDEMKRKRDYAPATIKLVLLRCSSDSAAPAFVCFAILLKSEILDGDSPDALAHLVPLILLSLAISFMISKTLMGRSILDTFRLVKRSE